LRRTTGFYYLQNVFINKIIITPGTENNAEIVKVSQLIQIEMGTKVAKALTPQIAPTPPITLVNSALKKLLLHLKIKNEIRTKTPTKIYKLVI
jgi:hypothetical protein